MNELNFRLNYCVIPSSCILRKKLPLGWKFQPHLPAHTQRVSQWGHLQTSGHVSSWCWRVTEKRKLVFSHHGVPSGVVGELYLDLALCQLDTCNGLPMCPTSWQVVDCCHYSILLACAWSIPANSFPACVHSDTKICPEPWACNALSCTPFQLDLCVGGYRYISAMYSSWSRQSVVWNLMSTTSLFCMLGSPVTPILHNDAPVSITGHNLLC